MEIANITDIHTYIQWVLQHLYTLLNNNQEWILYLLPIKSAPSFLHLPLSGSCRLVDQVWDSILPACPCSTQPTCGRRCGSFFHHRAKITHKTKMTSWISDRVSMTMSVLYLVHLVHQPWLLKQILLDIGSFNDSIGGKVDVNVLSKSTWVVITLGLGISKG